MIKAIIFDIGSTVIHNYWKSRIKSIKKETGIIIKNRPEIKHRIMSGKKSLKELLRLSHEESGSNLKFLEFVKSYNKNYEKHAPVKKKMLSLIKRLRKNYEVYALSNTNDIHENINRKRGVFKDFNKVFLSNKIGIIKPDKKAFKFVKNKIKVQYNSMVFIDDDEDNIKMAASLGIISIKYSNYRSLIKELNKIGLKIK